MYENRLNQMLILQPCLQKLPNTNSQHRKFQFPFLLRTNIVKRTCQYNKLRCLLNYLLCRWNYEYLLFAYKSWHAYRLLTGCSPLSCSLNRVISNYSPENWEAMPPEWFYVARKLQFCLVPFLLQVYHEPQSWMN